MDTGSLWTQRHHQRTAGRSLLGLLGLVLLLVSCSDGGESGSLVSPDPTSPAFADQQAVDNLLDLYRTAAPAPAHRG